MTHTPDARRSRQQIIIWVIGVLVAGVMVALGLWQMQVFRTQGKDALLARMHQPPVDVTRVADTSSIPRDAYGRSVTARGTYVAGHDILVPASHAPGCRVLTPLRLADGTTLPVVRGISPSCTPTPLPPGPADETGVFLPSEGDAGDDMGADRLGSVRLPRLVQRWDGPMLPGFLSLDEQHAAKHGLAAAAVALPDSSGQARNSGYALQWWIFAAAALGATIKLSRDAARQTGLMRPRDADVNADPLPDKAPGPREDAMPTDRPLAADPPADPPAPQHPTDA